MKKRNGRKIIACALAFVLMIGVLPTQAFAATDSELKEIPSVETAEQSVDNVEEVSDGNNGLDPVQNDSETDSENKSIGNFEFYMSRTYLRGEIYYADLDPVVGSEQMGTRPVLILQNNVGNHFARTVIVAPITSRIHTKSKIPTHSYIGMIGRMKYPSVVMLEQLRTLDKRRIGYYIGKLPEEKMQDVTRALCVSLAIRQNTAKGM